MTGVKSLAAAALMMPLASLAQVLFYNNGTLNGWDESRAEHNGQVREVDNVYFTAPTSLKMDQRYDASYTGRYHSEVDVNDGYTRGDSRFYGFAFKLYSGWEFDADQSYNLAQFISDLGGGCDDYMPSTMVWLVGDQLNTRLTYGTYAEPDCKRSFNEKRNLATVQPGGWHTVIIQADWQSDESGSFGFWFDGAKLVDDSGIATTIDSDNTFAFRVGLYANGWYDDDSMVGDQDYRQVWYDEVAIGTSYSDVEPRQD
ncbi:hypothetical protein GMORB2_5248 [Geosmithia morbida]|uniref:Polysaccharide lyase n=1 Tax=Geosmithia morbida TaxID=1094350 RepID=A0A9P4YZE8_9HYPO|nr:uncharacterized protein GMORB2_5248 [Geosmithia morbida]KAF4124582.1 hypothetical protein GMORB2_5248 [Geosmithia morbida]